MGGGAKVGARPPLEIPPKKIMCAVLFSSYGDFFHVEGLGEGFFFLLGGHFLYMEAFFPYVDNFPGLSLLRQNFTGAHAFASRYILLL